MQEAWETGEVRLFTFDPNSTQNEGRFRLCSPNEFEGYFRKKSSTKGVSYVMGRHIPSGGKVLIQAIRFNLGIWNEEDAKVWFPKWIKLKLTPFLPPNWT